MGDKKKEDEETDPRLEYFEEYLTKTMRLKADRWPKMIGNEELKVVITDFFDKPKNKALIFYMTPAGQLIPSTGYPSYPKFKSVYFVKKQAVVLTPQNIKSSLIFGDVSPNPVEELSVLVEEIFAPMLCNQQNQRGWPQCVADDVMKHIHSFRGIVYQIKGKIAGQTLLALPVGIEKVHEEVQRLLESDGKIVDLQLKSAIEGIVIKWAHQITEVLSEDSNVYFAGGAHPGPSAEIDFWNNRLKNLESLYDQLNDPRVKKMAVVLEVTDSAYYAAYKTFFRKVVAAVTEARDITLYLTPLGKHFEMIDSTEFIKVEPLLSPMLHIVCIIWANSRYYCLSQRIVILLKTIGNDIVEQCMKFLDPGSVFQGDPEETAKVVGLCLGILERFLIMFEEYREKMPSYFKKGIEPKLWSFNAKVPFQRMMDFIERLGILREFLNTAVDYSRLDRIEIAGIRGRNLGYKIIGIMEECKTCWMGFMSATYDPLDPEATEFLKHLEKFNAKSIDFDSRIASIFSQAFDDCYNLDSIFKLCNIMGSLAERPMIKADLQNKYQRILDLYNDDLDVVKEIFDETTEIFNRSGEMPVDLFMTQTAGIMCWIEKLRDRVWNPVQQMKGMEYYVVQGPDAENMFKKSEQMLTLIDNFQEIVMDRFAEVAPAIAEQNLNAKVIIRDNETLLISVNFSPDLMYLLRDLRYLTMLGSQNIPESIKDLNERSETLSVWLQHLNQIVKWYNRIRQKSRPVEFALFEDEVIYIDLLLDSAIQFLTWNSPETPKFIQMARHLIKKLYDRVVDGQENATRIYDLCFQWSNEPLFERVPKENLLSTEDRPQRVAARHQATVDAGVEIHELVDYNYHIYFDIYMPLEEEEAEVEDIVLDEEGNPIYPGGNEGEQVVDAEGGEDEDAEEEQEKLESDKAKKETAEKVVKVKKMKRRPRPTDEYDPSLYETIGPPAEDVSEDPGITTDEGVESQPEDTKSKKDKKGKEPKSPKSPKKEKPAGKEKKKAATEKVEEAQTGPSVAKKKEVAKFQLFPKMPEKAEPIDKNARWTAYLDYIDQVVTAGILSSIACSIGYILDETDPVMKPEPLLKVDLELKETELVFSPTIANDNSQFLTLLIQIETDIFGVGKLIERIATHKKLKNYQYEADGCNDLREMKEEIVKRAQYVTREAVIYTNRLDQYSYLWLDNRQEALEYFLRYSRTLTQEETDLLATTGDETFLQIPEKKPTNEDFKNKIDHYEDLYKELDAKIEPFKRFDCWFLVNMRPFKASLLNTVCKWGFLYKNYLYNLVLDSITGLLTFIKESESVLQTTVEENDYDALVRVMMVLYKIRERQDETDQMFEPLQGTIDLLRTYNMEFEDDIELTLQELPENWMNLKRLAVTVRQQIAPLVAAQVSQVRQRLALFEVRQMNYREVFKNFAFYSHTCTNVYKLLDEKNKEICQFEDLMKALKEKADLFEVSVPDFKEIKQTRKELKLVKVLWDFVNIIQAWFDEWKRTLWKKIDVEAMDMECKRFGRELRGLDKDVRGWEVYNYAEGMLKNMMTSLRAITELQNPAIRERHWVQLMQATKVKFVMDDSTTLRDLMDLNLHKFEEEVKLIVDKSVKEMAMEKILIDIEANWKDMGFDKGIHARTNTTIISASEEMIELLENDQNQLQNMMSSKFIDYFYQAVSLWQRQLMNCDQVISIWMEVQRAWQYLESIFIGSEDIRSQLPEDSKRFDTIDKNFRELLTSVVADMNVVRACNKPGLYDKLCEIQKNLTLCEKALADYLETKRLIYPRFYFVSSADLLDILSTGNSPELVCRHLIKLYDSLGKLRFNPHSKIARGMQAKDGEYVEFKGTCDCGGKVEVWLNRVTEIMRKTLRIFFKDAVIAYDEKPRDQFLFDFPAQVALCGTQIWWTTEVNQAFARLEEGYENALKDYNRKQIYQLSVLITLLCGELTPGDRQKIMTVCTIDVHSRDVIAKIIIQKVDSSSAFQWQSQLRHRWDKKVQDCFGNICDAQFKYDYEYLGCTPRLVITPLTDRCYITLTQSLHLIMGGAPAGPAGTGKTETTKDLGRALGIMVYVFNCSEQMDYKSIGNIYKGLAQTGAWGCFDEFNRISVEVLSVVAVQVKAIQDAIRAKKVKFDFLGEIIGMIPTVGIFITMNPGYAGRTELPENLKALFRPCAMVVPDFELICEIMLIAEGFQEARVLARKFITLYTLCKELLSKQDHYDWGLRAIKSVLVVAGSLKRSDRNRPEDQVLMRALRDFNIPKIVTDDMTVFMGLIGDLFPALDVPRKRDPEFEKEIRLAAIDMKLQPEENFILKCVQLEELFAVRHSVFIIGFAGTGKTQVWKTLNRTYALQKKKPWYNDLNPKAVSCDELFGVINPATREWKDGLFSVIMRDQANMSGDGPKWIVLDGDIDPMWIESLNTLMDDNKVLTLASNERIALTPQMRLLFEISNLKTATPATVSRAGILYINPADMGWNPFVSSWIDRRTQQSEKAQLIVLFDKYVQPCLDVLRTKFKKITPLPEINHVHMLCNLLECLLTPQNVPPDCPKEWYEVYFVFASVWAFGSATFQDQMVDWRNEFHKWWISEFKTIKFPSYDTVFNYFIDPETKKFLPWSEKVKPYVFDPDIPLQAALVNTPETTRIRFFVDTLMSAKVPVMLIGGAGGGKSVIIADKLSSLTDAYAVTNVPFNFYTNSEMLQKIMEKPLEKKSGRVFGPPAGKTMVYFIDDMNMPEVDKYGTVQPHTLIRQHIDYMHWYDRAKLTLKEIVNIQYVSCMNPTAGSFTIDPRLQRHFAVFAVSFPSSDSVCSIYEKILSGHLTSPTNKFHPALLDILPTLMGVAVGSHLKVAQNFLPTAIKFHYIFNMRDLANIFQGMLFSNAECIPDQNALIRLWLHEAFRVYGDKLIDEKDRKDFISIVRDQIRKGFEEINEEEIFIDPLIFCHFAEGIGESKYLPVKEWKTMNRLLEDALSQYNDLVASANLVLFEDAMNHICRISRILESPRGNALLVGVGGSGKQSLARLAAFISTLEVFQLQLKKGYGLADLRADIAAQYLKAGVKNVGLVFLMTDGQVADEKFLVLINDCLASGDILELFADDEADNIIGAIRNEVKNAGIFDSKENCWKFFIDKVRRMMKIVLCFSPVGATLRIRARKFPAVVNCTAIDWFHEWPEEALISVSFRFLQELPSLPVPLRDPVSRFMAFVHISVNETSQAYFQNEKRYNYTTPKSFLEQIALYSKLLTARNEENWDRINRLENGLTKLVQTAQQVDGLKTVLAAQEIIVNEKNAAADALISVVGAESEKVAKEKAIAAEEEEKVKIIEEDVTIKQKICEEDLSKAEPALVAAQAALDTLDKSNLTEFKSFGTPPPGLDDVTAAVMVLFAPKGKIPRVQDRSWKNSKIMMGKVDDFLYQLKNYDKENIQADAVKAVKVYLEKPGFNPESIKTKSNAAAGLCAWVINIIKFYEVFEFVGPKRLALAKANQDLADARQKLKLLNDKLKALEDRLSVLTAEFDQATAVKMRCQAEADATALTINIAHRLIGGLGSENVRWRESVANFKRTLATLPGDILLVTAFISYAGCFTRRYRIDLMEKQWFPAIKSMKPEIPMTQGADPLFLLADDAQIAAWSNEGLPSDRMSVENATIMMNSARWPLMIDPQLQGIKWVKQKYGESLNVIRLGQRNYLDKIEYALSEGQVMLIEFIGESLDAVLDPLLGRTLVRKGRAIRMGDKEIDFNPTFKLILQTKLANPHYKPEMQAQTTLINFTVTKDGLEEQLLGEVVKCERPDLELLKTELTRQQNTFKVTLKKLEDDLLFRLSAADTATILSDVTLVENLETTKSTAAEINIKVAEAKITSVKIDDAREQYRPVAARAALLYFVLNDLCKINLIYQFSLKAFSVVFNKAMELSEPADTLKQRVAILLENVTYFVFMYTNRALFEVDKLIFKCHMCLQILIAANEVDPSELDFLLRFPSSPNVVSPVDFLTHNLWGAVKFLSGLKEFASLDKDIESSSKRWKKFADSETPEREKFPGEWKTKSAVQRLCMMRCFRPDRMTYAVGTFIEEKLGLQYAEARTVEFAKSYDESSPATPMFFILSPGVDPLKDVEKLGKKLGFTGDKKNFHNVSLGQGQEIVAEQAMDVASKKGHWVILQNIHLVQSWLSSLEKKIEQCVEGAHEKYRLFVSAAPAPSADSHIIPQGILESAIKITNEPPTGMLANLHKALDNFSQETLEMCSKEAEFKSILYALCYFHAVVAERRKFGAQGWNRVYPFNIGDLTISVSVLYNYLENNARIPWEDLRYLFGEIMYGGHITDDWDRRLCRTYLEEYMKPELVDGDLFLAPNFPGPPNLDFVGYHAYTNDYLPAESPNLYGLHLNAEIGFLTSLSENLFRTVFELQPKEAGKGEGVVLSREEKVKLILDDILDKAPEEFNIADIMTRIEDKNPYVLVAFQELERMNILFREIKRSLKELDLGLKGELTISTDMEVLMDNLFMDIVPAEWVKRAYPSMLGLGAWYADLINRLRELESWASDFAMPSTVWLAGFFNPQSFLTAIMQSTARKNEWPLDKMCLSCEVTKKFREDFQTAPREGANIHGLFMEGARWDIEIGGISESNLKELFPNMPVIYIKAITQDKQDLRGMYDCPVYKTRQRGPTYVWTFNLRTKEKPSKWTLAGVALLLGI